MFWVPLSATWLMMALEGPFLTALIARCVDPKFNLAAHGVAFAFAILVEAPVIMMLGASTALVDGRVSFLRLRDGHEDRFAATRFAQIADVRRIPAQ